MRQKIDISHLIIALLVIVGLAIPISQAVDQTFDKFPLRISCKNDFESLALAGMEIPGPRKNLSQSGELNSIQRKAMAHYSWRFSQKGPRKITLKTNEHQTLSSESVGFTTTISETKKNGEISQEVTYYTNAQNKLLKYSTRVDSQKKFKKGPKIREEWLCHTSQATLQANSSATTVFPST